MSDSGFRERLFEQDISEEEIEHLLVYLNSGETPLRVTVRSKNSESGYTLHRRTPTQAMYFLVCEMEERRGLSEYEALQKTFESLTTMKEIMDTKGTDTLRSRLGLLTGDQLEDFVYKVRMKEINKSESPYEYRQASKTVLDGINENFIGMTHEIEHRQNHKNGSEHIQNIIDGTLRSYRHDVNMRHTAMDADLELMKARTQNIKLRSELRGHARKNIDIIHSKGRKITKSLERISERIPSKIKNKVQAKKIEKFWGSDEGKLRRDNMVMQAALISLHTRRMLGQTKRKKITNYDMNVGRKITKEYMEKGTTNRSEAFKDIHRARIIATDWVVRDSGIDRKKVSAPSLKRVYSSIYGVKITASEITKQISLKDSGLILDPKLRRNINREKANFNLKPSGDVSNINILKVNEEGIQKLRSALHRGIEKAKVEKILDPANQEIRERSGANLKRIENIMNNIQTLKANFQTLVFEKEKSIKEGREKELKEKKLKEEILEKKEDKENSLKQEMGPEAYEKMKLDRENEALKQEQNLQQKKDADDYWD